MVSNSYTVNGTAQNAYAFPSTSSGPSALRGQGFTSGAFPLSSEGAQHDGQTMFVHQNEDGKREVSERTSTAVPHNWKHNAPRRPPGPRSTAPLVEEAPGRGRREPSAECFEAIRLAAIG
jgi:hypothetical protein